MDFSRFKSVRYWVAMLLLAVAYGAALFLVMQGVLRLWELNSDDFSIMKPWCEPKGFFGWGYECDQESFNEYSSYPTIDFNFTFLLDNSTPVGNFGP